MAKLKDRLVSKDLLDEEGAASELVIASLQRPLMVWVEAENVSTSNHDELALAIGPPGQLGLVGSHFLSTDRDSRRRSRP